MYLFVLSAGVVLAALGIATAGFGIPIYEFGLGNTLIIAGTTMFAGGLVLVGLAAVLRELRALREALAGTPAALLAQAAHGLTEPGLAEPAAAERAAHPALQAEVAAEQRRATFSAERREPQAPPLSPRAPSWPRPGARAEGTAAEGTASAARSESRAPGAEPPSGAHSARESSAAEPRSRRIFDRPARAERAGEGANVGARPAAGAEEQAGPAARTAREPGGPAILKSGVIDGMAYTLYADGSIEAQLPGGLMRFSSIEKLRDYLEREGG